MRFNAFLFRSVIFAFLFTVSPFFARWNALSAAGNGSSEASGSFTEKQTPEFTAERGLQYFRRKLDAGIMPGDGAYKNDVAVTALTGMAFLASGSTPEEGKDSVQAQRCLDFILKNVQKSGIIAQKDASLQGMVYAHGFAVTFLAECLGMTAEDEKLRVILEKAVLCIVNAQGKNGGWRYSFTPGEEDVSVTACMLTALRACRNAGIRVPADTVRNGILYILSCQNPDGGFRYRLADGPSAYPRSAAAVAGLCAAGTYESPEIQRALNYMKRFSSDFDSESRMDGYYFYAQYYAVQAYFLTEPQNSEKDENTSDFQNAAGFEEWYTQAVRKLQQEQKPDGSWNSAISTDYATAMALIVLQMKNNYLPIFTR